MKHQNFKDRMHEHEGMMHHGHHKHHSGPYEHGVDKPHIPKHGHQEHGMGVSDFKGQAQEIAFGQASVEGMRADAKRMSSQFKNYHWDEDTGGASGY